MNPDAGLIYSYYKDGALAPTFVYIKAGYKISKVGGAQTRDFLALFACF